ncbi:nucleotide-binding protein [Vulcanisaeta sp. JCM 14467]|uniref:nucleotide-binding protein n=1 Tax=Vulcanisaeta sp. JCM 14467 TaxID=1295370 RepID=UPI002092E713|nr:hypothetical protein [Vulcanisaeta sp. JCM 14467]
MALKPRYVVMVFFSGSKGGTGKSTLAANLAILLSQSLKTNTLLIDLGVDSTKQHRGYSAWSRTSRVPWTT